MCRPANPSPPHPEQAVELRSPQRVRTSQRKSRVEPFRDGVQVVHEEHLYLVQVIAADARPSINRIALTFAPDAITKASSFLARSKAALKSLESPRERKTYQAERHCRVFDSDAVGQRRHDPDYPCGPCQYSEPGES